MQATCPRCGPAQAITSNHCWYCGQPVADVHIYLSTSCLHDRHDYCNSPTGYSAADLPVTFTKKPATCKFCDAPCICECHSGENNGR